MKLRLWTLIALALAVGMFIGFIDSRPTWDDTAITVLMVVASSALFGFMVRRRLWLWPFALVCGFTVFEFNSNQTLVNLFVFAIALAGCYAGKFVRYFVSPSIEDVREGAKHK